MKTKLDQLTLSQFIDLVCGNTDVLREGRELLNPHKTAIAMRNIVIEYRSIADPGNGAAYLKHIDDIIKDRLNVVIFSMCQNLVLLKQYGRAREVLIAYGLPADSWKDARVESEIHVRLQKSKRVKQELDDAASEDIAKEQENIRDAFNAMIATMIAHFKFQIEPTTMMAPVFAHLVARHNREVKAMQKAMSKHK